MTRKLSRQATSRSAVPAAQPLPDTDPLLDFEPVPHTAPRRNSITPDRQRTFIAHLAATGIVTQAAKHIGALLEALYKLRRREGAQGFAAAWDRAVDAGIARLEDGALARAIEGEERMVVSAGKVVGTEIRHNDALVMFFLRHRRSARYGKQLQPGDGEYERIRAEVMEAHRATQRSPEEVLASLNAKLDKMRERRLAFEKYKADEAAAGRPFDAAELPGEEAGDREGDRAVGAPPSPPRSGVPKIRDLG